MPEISPSNMAQQMATAYVQKPRQQLDSQNKEVKEQTGSLTTLQTALSELKTALATQTEHKGVLAMTATPSVEGVLTATASGDAAPGNYPLFVEQVASAHQLAFRDLVGLPLPAAGKLTVRQHDGSRYELDLAQSDADKDGTVSPSEFARAFNQACEGKINASVLSTEGSSQLMLTAAATGRDAEFSLELDALPASQLKTVLAAPQVLVAAKDAVVWLGPQGSGVRIEQPGNTIKALAGVSLELVKPMEAGAAPLSLSVARDDAATAEQVQAFVDAYNKTRASLDGLLAAADQESGKPAGTFISDAGVRSLRDHINSAIRQDFDGNTLMRYGISANRDGSLKLDKAMLKSAVERNPAGLKAIFGEREAGLGAELNDYLDSWLSSSNGQIKQRQDSLHARQKTLDTRQTRIDGQYEQAYQRYQKQYGQLEALQSQMAKTSNVLDGLAA